MVFEEWAKLEGDKIPSNSHFSENIFEYLTPNATVLDLGCGYGRVSKILKCKGYQVFGIDVNSAAIETAKTDSSLEGVAFGVQNGTNTNFPDQSFYAVVEQAVLACMEKEDRLVTLQEMNRVLKGGGILSIAEFGLKPNIEKRYERDAKVTGEYGTMLLHKDDGSDWFRSHNFTKKELEGLIQAAGFTILQYDNRSFTSIKGDPWPGHTFIVKKS